MKRRNLHIIVILLVFQFFTSIATAGHTKTDSCYYKGMSELHKSNYNVALRNLLKFIQTEEQQKSSDKEKLLRAYMAAGSIHNVYSDFEQAVEFYDKGLYICKELNDQKAEFELINNLIGIFCDSKKLAIAEKYNVMILNLNNVNVGMRKAYYLFNKGYIAKGRGDDNTLVNSMKEGLILLKQYNLSPVNKVYPYQEIYQAYERQGLYDKTLKYLNEYYNVAVISNQKYLVIDCYKAYMRLYTKIGNKEKSLYYQDKYFKYTDSILNMRNFIQIRNEHLAYEKHVTGVKIDNLEQVSTMQRNMLVVVILGLVLTLLVVFVIYRQYRTLHTVNQALYERNRELLEADVRSHTTHRTKDIGRNSTDDKETESRNDDLLDKINTVMADEDTFCNSDFSLTMLADLVGSNTLYISQVINTTYYKNFRSFINEYRVRVGMKRLMDTDNFGNYSIQGIAESVGYKSASNFVLAFKKVTGMTPSLYKKMTKEKNNRINL